MAPLIEVRSCKYDGHVHRRWAAEVIEERDTSSLIVLRGVFEREVRHALLGTVEAGTVSTEYYWRDRWYSIFRFVAPSGALKYYYCNVNLPPRVSDSVLSFVDLDIDLLVAPDFSYQVLDEDEFEAHIKLWLYPEELVRRARAAVGELIALVDARRFPFNAEE